ncbi:hypothetical protein C0V70_09610 [Bacteriovorax stolpii]|uniref:Uncharacterized protein n=1 Tax=Bacteriovorax stolpii TaxID=960 RepID=A0A2K9NTE6_BACTC|nr:FAD-binding oxidoreductase [Bacteriovorax stolpii]AUN98355.1 hypothetical protein C0V70_09610 [Bacteriovorax stolpii]TDP52280.1 hypothetical protein C8D79_2932 [Bacteriovorax stolpii]
MGNSSNQTIFDLAVIGNGVAAQSFLWNLSLSERKSQNFSIAHIFSNEIAPACSLRTCATVSLNGIEEDVSPLGNDMREAFFLFDDLYKTYHPEGVEEVKRVVISTNENDTKKLLRRYKKLDTIKNPRIHDEHQGTEYNSYIISPEIFSSWLSSQITVAKTNFPFFAKDLEKRGEHFAVKLADGREVLARKVLFATGAFAKIFERFHAPPEAESIEDKNTIKAGSFLERDIDLGEKSFYISIDGNYVLYRRNALEKKLIIGSLTTIGAYEAPDVHGLSKLLLKMKGILTFDVGEMKDYKITTGLRHKGPRRLLIAGALDEEKKLFRVNGLYKNGFTMAFLAAKRLEKMIF